MKNIKMISFSISLAHMCHMSSYFKKFNILCPHLTICFLLDLKLGRDREAAFTWQMLSSPHQIGNCPLHNPQPFGHFSPQLFCFSLVQTWVYLTELNYVKSQIRWYLTQLTEMALTEPDWDWHWSHPAPSSGSQQCNCNQAAKKRNLASFFAVLACHNWDSAGLQQTMLKNALLLDSR